MQYNTYVTFNLLLAFPLTLLVRSPLGMTQMWLHDRWVLWLLYMPNSKHHKHMTAGTLWQPHLWGLVISLFFQHYHNFEQMLNEWSLSENCLYRIKSKNSSCQLAKKTFALEDWRLARKTNYQMSHPLPLLISYILYSSLIFKKLYMKMALGWIYKIAQKIVLSFINAYMQVTMWDCLLSSGIYFEYS